MNSRIISAVLAMVISMTAAQPAMASIPMVDKERGILTIAPLLDNATPGVVNISVKTRVAIKQNPMLQDPFFRRFFDLPNQAPARESMSAGSGVIVDAKDGLVVTNHHVINNATSILVTLKDKRQFKAELVGSDAATDIALLKIEPDNLTEVPIGNSDTMKVGDVVIAIGNPFGIGQTVTSGIVSALGRSGLGIEGYEDFIQTDASINPGNSGGALVNSKGELIGINTAIIGPGGGNVGIGFAVPSNMAKAVMEQLKTHGKVSRGQLGVSIQDLTPDIAEALGLTGRTGGLVTSVEPGSSAAKAGIEAGDVIVAINGTALKGSSDLRNRIGLVRKGSEITLSYIRGLTEMETVAQIGDAETENYSISDALQYFSGARFTDNDTNSVNAIGVTVSDVQRGSPAWHYGMRPGDVVTSVNNEKIRSVDQLMEILKKPYRVIAMNVVRDNRNVFVVIERKDIG